MIDLNQAKAREERKHCQAVDERARIESALTAIDPQDRETWVAIGQAVQDELGEDGFLLWDDWSQGADNYSERAARDTWRSFGQGGGRTVATLFKLARENGWSDNTKPEAMTVEQAEARNRSREEAARLNREATAKRHADRAAVARELYAAARIEGAREHAYTARKRLDFGPLVRRGRFQDHDCLVVPIYGQDGQIWTVQAIAGGPVFDGNRDKTLLAGARKAGCFLPIGPTFRGASRVCIAEGLATAAAIHAATDLPCLMAVDAGNMLPVAHVVRRLAAPGADIIILADDDQQPDRTGNPGMEAATRAAQAIGARVARPDMGRKADMWDVWAEQGPEAVRARIDAAPPVSETDTPADNPSKAAPKQDAGTFVESRQEDLDTWIPALKTWPVLDRAALPGLVGDFVDLATECSEADPAAVLATVLVRFGIEAGSPAPAMRPHLYIGETRHESRLFAVVTGQSSKARKGTSASPVARVFSVPAESTDAPSMAATSLGPLSSGEGIVYAVRDTMETWDEKDQSLKISDPGVADKRLYVQEEEFAAAINAGKREGNTLSATLRALWDSGTRSPMTKTSRTKCTDAHVGILAHITLDELALCLSHADKLNGYANRFLWVLARRTKRISRPRRMPDDRFVPIRNGIWRRLKRAHEAGQMSFTLAAGDLWDSEYDRLTEDRPGIAGAITARGEAQVVRLSMIYALFDGKKEVDSEHIRAALAMWNYSQASAEYIFSDDAKSSKLDAKIREVLLVGRGGMTLTEMHRATGNNHKAAEMRGSIQRLVDAGVVRAEAIKTKGAAKPTTIFSLNELTSFTNLRISSETGRACKFVNSSNSFVRTQEIPDDVKL